MKNSFKVVILLFLFPGVTGAIDLFDEDENVIWKSRELFVKLESPRADSSKVQLNDHPVTLDVKRVTHALRTIEFFQQGGLLSRDKQNLLFSEGQSSILGVRIVEGLIKARPDQDITFALARLADIGLGMKDRAYTAGRVFYKDNHLHIIIGDFNRPPDKAQEQANKSAGQEINEFTYIFDTGKRYRNKKRDFNIISGNGIETQQVGDVRQRDWIVVNLDQAAAHYALIQNRNDPDRKAVEQQKALETEAARMAQERRELRMEMARMRKEMQELSEEGENSSGQSIQERMATLDDLFAQGLISKEEYEQKREDILSDI